MKKIVLVGIAAGISAFGVSSCAYDPYYSGGYGSGYGYGGSGFSTSYFVSTGSSRWGYDPYAGAYYDYTRRCYYDPYLNGYYPVGYRPRYVYGAPHPHGWSRGSNYCPPPSSVRSYTLTNYHNRSERYRSLGRSWSNNVRVDTHGGNHRSGYGSSRGDRDDNHRGSIFGGSGDRSSYSGRTPGQGGYFGDRSGRGDNRTYIPQRGGDDRSGFREREPEVRGTRRIEGSYVPSSSRREAPSPSRFFGENSGRGDWSGRSGARPEPQRSAPQFNRGGGGSDRDRDRGNEDSGRGQGRGIRGLGEG